MFQGSQMWAFHAYSRASAYQGFVHVNIVVVWIPALYVMSLSFPSMSTLGIYSSYLVLVPHLISQIGLTHFIFIQTSFFQYVIVHICTKTANFRDRVNKPHLSSHLKQCYLSHRFYILGKLVKTWILIAQFITAESRVQWLKLSDEIMYL